MRVTSALWVAALLRRQQSAGAFVTVSRKGAEEAGAIFIVQNHLDSQFSLFGPAPQAVFGTSDSSERKFERIKAGVPETEVEEYLRRQLQFDSDAWIVEVELRTGDPEIPISAQQ